MNADPAWANLSTTSTIKTGSTFAVPSSVLQTAVTPSGNSTVLNVISWQDTTAKEYVVYLHFADFQSSKLREFDAYPDANQVVYNYTPHYLSSSSVYTPLFRAIAGEYNITLAATANSALPPMLNAFEIYFLITYDGTATFSKDCKLTQLRSLTLNVHQHCSKIWVKRMYAIEGFHLLTYLSICY